MCSAGKNRVKAVKELASILFKQSKRKVIIKNIDKELEKLTKFKGFRHYSENETWDSFSKYDDNTFDKNELIRCQEMFGTLRNDFFQYIIYEKRTRKYIGFISLSAISESCAGHNALIYDFNDENLSRKLMQEAIKIGARLGFEFINLQGSEDKNQFESKLKFKPNILLQRKHIVYEE